ncbi:phosphodiester glycosidase family protein [Cochlodiniinecator piscidefendens]|uniref:phosphodiester glycosidase family protein n=1 Tax=Cochlodiniinecator piscidefendens TaxID=2715756 RepID=UPI00140C7357|nr:phosphodiester glycosidase family protein [Cochlodiniinecator piscidefendens]
MIRLWAAFLCVFGFAAKANAACEPVTYQGNDYTMCTAQIGDDVQLFHSNAEGRLYGNFGAVLDSLPDGQILSFAMNAGMYHQDRRPVGLFIEDNTVVSEIVDGGGYGNFGLTPNGVFCITPDRFAVIETQAFRADTPDCTYATQSGPMLVINNELHPRFLVESDSRYIRNGVGVSADGQTATFVISENTVNFHSFASLFRDHLGLPNALYFDGKVSRLYAPNLDRWDNGFPLGVIVGIVSPETVDAASSSD